MSSRFLNASTVIESLRDNGYNNTAYALAELIDNSLQAKATRVEVGFIEAQLGSKNNYTVSEISIWDNGIGMDKETLRTAMMFGGGNHRHDKDGMGKFGMGLPNSSISQCKRVDVWSWTDNGKPNYTYLDVDEMKSGSLEDVPEPLEQDLPEQYQRSFFSQRPESGTLVVWSKLDRLSWKTGQSIYRHCEMLVGRMYRNFIWEDNIKIQSTTYRKSADNKLGVWSKETFKANDPMYLKKNTSLPTLPGSYKNEALFELQDQEVVSVEYLADDGTYKRDDVTITASIIKKAIAKKITKGITGKLGDTEWGKHLGRNIGVSIVRANRELVLRDSFIPNELRRYKGRYCGLEVSFPPTLDAVFGVTNNKQDAVKLIPYDMKSISENSGFDSEQEFLSDLELNNDPLRQVFKVTREISKQISALTKALDEVNVTGTARRGEGAESLTSAETAASKATQGSDYRETHGYKTESVGEDLVKDDVVEYLVKEGGMSKEEAEEKADRLILTGNRFLIEDVARDSDAFFDVSTSQGLTLVLFNTNHLFYRELVSKLQDSELEVMQTAIAGFARVMNETTNEKRKNYLNTVRRDWGKVISEFLMEASDEDPDDI